jgi:hypothetical protein
MRALQLIVPKDFEETSPTVAFLHACFLRFHCDQALSRRCLPGSSGSRRNLRTTWKIAGSFPELAAMIKRSKKLKKPRLPTPATPAPNEVPPSDGLVFEAAWDDGITTRMSVYTFVDDLDLKRAIALSKAAYSSRKRIPLAEIKAIIVQAQFRDSGNTIIATHDAAQLKEIA